MHWFDPYRKTVTAVITGIVGWLIAVLSSDDSGITNTEWIMLITAVATALGVFTFRNIANAPKTE